MAQLQLKPPEPVQLQESRQLAEVEKRFEQYRSASGLTTETAASQINTLLSCLGEEAGDVLTSTGISAANKIHT